MGAGRTLQYHQPLRRPKPTQERLVSTQSHQERQRLLRVLKPLPWVSRVRDRAQHRGQRAGALPGESAANLTPCLWGGEAPQGPGSALELSGGLPDRGTQPGPPSAKGVCVHRGAEGGGMGSLAHEHPPRNLLWAGRSKGTRLFMGCPRPPEACDLH